MIQRWWGKCAKSWQKNPWKFKTIQPSHGINGLARNCKKPNPPTQWVRVE